MHEFYEDYGKISADEMLVAVTFFECLAILFGGVFDEFWDAFSAKTSRFPISNAQLVRLQDGPTTEGEKREIVDTDSQYTAVSDTMISIRLAEINIYIYFSIPRRPFHGFHTHPRHAGASESTTVVPPCGYFFDFSETTSWSYWYLLRRC